MILGLKVSQRERKNTHSDTVMLTLKIEEGGAWPRNMDKETDSYLEIPEGK